MPLEDNLLGFCGVFVFFKEQRIQSVIRRHKSKEIENEKYKKFTCIQVFKE